MAAAASKAPKRKSTESTEQMLKKIKVAKSSERPQPVKSALKTANGAKTASPARGKTATGKPAAKVTKPQKGKKSAPKVEEKVETAAEKIAATKNAVMEAATAKAKVAKETAKKEKAEAKKVVDKVAVDAAEVVESAKSAVKSKAGKKAKKSKAEEELLDSEDEETGGELTADQTAALMAGFSSSDEESDDEGIPLDKLPKANNAKAVEAINAAKELPDDPESTPGVIYVGRLPHGFQDPQMRAYFKQFGEITNLRVARNKKTYKSKHYAFVEFASSAVADIVVKAMDKYLMFNHILQVKRVPPQQVHPRLWEKTKKPVNQARLEGLHLKRGRTEEQWDKAIERENKKRRSTASKLAELGYDFIAPVLNVFGASTAVEATPDKQLLEDVKQAAEAPEKNVSNSSKKRTAASQPEKKKAKKTKAKA